MEWLSAELPASLKHFRLVFAAEIKRLVAYRVQFWCELVLSSLVELLVTCTMWRAVFETHSIPIIDGYTYPEMVLYVVIAVFFGQAIRGTSVGTFAREIYDGSLTKYLVYPLSIYSYKFGTFLPRGVFALGQLMIALLLLWALGYWPDQLSLSLGNILVALLAVLFACGMYFMLLFCIESGAFWVDQIWALSVMLQFVVVLLSGRWIPLDLFPDTLHRLLLLTPFPYLAFFPVKIFLGGLSAPEIVQGFIVLFVWLVGIFLASRFLYRRGLHQYSGVGM